MCKVKLVLRRQWQNRLQYQPTVLHWRRVGHWRKQRSLPDFLNTFGLFLHSSKENKPVLKQNLLTCDGDKISNKKKTRTLIQKVHFGYNCEVIFILWGTTKKHSCPEVKSSVYKVNQIISGEQAGKTVPKAKTFFLWVPPLLATISCHIP